MAGHSLFEFCIARHAEVTLTRDEPTAKSLAARGVRARWAGNLMMYGVAHPDAGALPIDEDALRIAVLPGSRRNAAANAGDAVRRLRSVAAALAPARVQAFVSVAGNAAADDMAESIAAQGVSLQPTAVQTGVVARSRPSETNLDVVLVRGRFAELLAAADIAIGQAGTANEQAAGLGKPVIAASDPGKAPQRAGWYRQRQQRLLGDALLVLPGDDREFVDGVLRLIRDQQQRERMSRAGRERMGGPGGSARVAETVLSLSERRGL